MTSKLAITAIALIACAAAAVFPWHPRPTSLVIITLDTTRADRLSVYGFNNVPMPGLERLAREGVVFDRATSVAPLTLPAHCSLFTGLFPPAHGVRDNADGALAAEQTTLAEMLRARGFQTAAFVSSVVLDADRGLAQGFDHYSAVSRPAPSTRSAGPPRRPADAVVNDALQWIEAHDDKPFFAWVHLYDAHRPYEPPEPFRSQYDDPYLAEIAFADSQIARLLATLEDRKVLDRTIVVAVGDHGESLGEHGERDHGIFVYESSMQVPLIVRVPGLAPRRVGTLVSLVDIVPMLLDLFQIPAPSHLDGLSLAPALRGQAMPERELYGESMYPSRFGWSPLRMVRDTRLKYIDAPRPELYDLEADPFEQHDISSQRPLVVAGMRARLDAIGAEKRAGIPGSSPSDETLRALASLGYVSGRTAAPPSSALDPKDFIQAFNLRSTAR
jgi:arylsulfatase A-like enzyme